MKKIFLSDKTPIYCLIPSEAFILDDHIKGYLEHGIHVKENDVGTRFRSPAFNDMINPLNLSPDDDEKSDKFNELTFATCNYAPVQGRLLIFRSYV